MFCIHSNCLSLALFCICALDLSLSPWKTEKGRNAINWGLHILLCHFIIVGFFLFVCFLTSCALSQSRLSHDCLLWERTVNLLFYKPLSGNQTLLLDAHDLSSLIYSCYRTCKWQCHCYEAAWSIIFQNPQPGLSCVKRHSGQMGFKTCVFPVAVKTQCTLEKQFFSFFFFLLSLMCNQLCDGIWAVLKVSGH